MGTIDSSFVLAGLGGVVWGLLLASQVVPWVWAFVSAPARDVIEAFSPHALTFVLRLLVLGAVFWLIWRSLAIWRSAFFGGALIGTVLFVAEIAWLKARQRTAPEPLLTVEALEKKRRRFVVSCVLIFTIGYTTIMYASDSARGIVFLSILIGPAIGYIWAIIMWQWLRASYVSADNARRKNIPGAPVSPFIFASRSGTLSRHKGDRA